MIQTSDLSGGLRRAALALHSLGHADRDWLLQQLSFGASQSLKGLLIELSDLGIPPDAEVIRTALLEGVPGAVLNPQLARRLCVVLAEQPPAMQSLLLATLPEIQRGEVLRHWPHDVLAHPSAVADTHWMPALQDAVRRSWHELAQLREERVA